MKINLILLFISYIFNAHAVENVSDDIITDEVIPIGKVNYLRGNAFRNGTKLSFGSEVFEGDTIRTMKSSVVKIVMSNDSTLTIAPLSEMIIEQYKSDDENLIHLLKGLTRVTYTI